MILSGKLSSTETMNELKVGLFIYQRIFISVLLKFKLCRVIVVGE